MTQTKEWLNVLSECADIIQKRDGHFKCRGLQKGIDILATYKTPVTLKQLKAAKMSNTAIALLEEFVSTGKIKLLEEEKNKPEYTFLQIYGIGMVKARELVLKGLTTIEQLREHEELLNPTQKKGLKYVESTIKRIPRDEIELYKQEFTNIMTAVAPPNATYEIVGSYRRGATNSGDIDVILYQKDNIPFLPVFLKEAIRRGVIVETLSHGPIKSLTIATLPGQETPFRRVDLLYSPPKEYPYAILYFTGSKWFNTAMRQRALDLGYSLNEHGFTTKETGEKVELQLRSEEEIFAFLQMTYKAPHERVDAHSVELLDALEKPLIQPAANYLQQLVSSGGSMLQSLTLTQIADMIRYATDKYSIGEPVIGDELFDGMKAYLESIQPDHSVLTEVGSEVTRQKVSLPYYMASMDKIKPEGTALTSWINKYPKDYVISAKLDGISALYSSNPLYLYTRGNGSIGQNISHLIPYLQLPKTTECVVIRGEIIISKNIFKDFSGKFANPRNLTAGIVNSTTEDPEKYAALHFVAYELIEPTLPPLEQMKYLKTLDITVVRHHYYHTLTNPMLSDLLLTWRKEYDYEIDGIIVTHDKSYPREKKNPKHAFAFKMMTLEDMVETTVMDILWTPSKDGYLKPRLLLEPVIINGSTVSYVTAFNGKYIESNHLGPGSKVLVGLSGGVIPHIFEVTYKTTAKMPPDDYKWSENDVDIILSLPEENETVQSKQILRFFDKLDVEGLKAGTVKQLATGSFDTIPKILAMKEEDFETVEGFGKKKARKVYSSIQSQISATSCVDLMCASNTFGRGMGEKKLRLILDQFPDILTSQDSVQHKLTQIAGLKGMSEKTAHLFVDHIDSFLDFMDKAHLRHKVAEIEQPQAKDKSHPLFQKHIVLTGFRDKDLMKQLTDVGAVLTSSVSKNTFVVLVKQEETTGKTQQANAVGVPVMLSDLFKTKYQI